ncbi:MAG: DEAD/DEAH box helicase [Planctomycetia bacterium]|nr:DEAD/DEAH box helicase [Planctomycetia bacterium]
MQWQLKKGPARSETKAPKVKHRKRRAAGKVKKADKPAKLSRLAKPESMSLEEWQVALRRQFGREQPFTFKNLGDEPIFSEFEVANPQTKRAYRVQIRGQQPGDNHCSCPDFATNTLGTCKHIEFTLAQLERKRGGLTALKAGQQPEYSEVYLHYGAQREVRFRPGAACPTSLARLAARYFAPDGSLLPEAFGSFDTFLAEAGRGDQEVRCQEDVLAFIAEVRDAERRRKVVAEAFPRGVKSAAFKDLLKIPLYDYQREGALFAAAAGRSLIGDEMGLGKTIQAVAATEIMAKHFGVERVLIVCPTSLKHQWQREIARFVERSTEVIGGLRRSRERGFATDTFFKITNYDTVHADVDLIQHWAPDLVILDEAQRIKNWNTRTARSVKRIASPYAIVLTGTPLENRLEELISIVQFVDRYRFGPTFRMLHNHQIRDEHGKVVGYRDLDRIGQTLEPLLVRRQKDQVLDQLPERIDSNIFVPMTPLQMTHHTENQEIVARIVQKWRRYRFLSEADQRRLMIALQRMRMACDSSYLVDHQSDHGVKADEAVTLLEEILERPTGKVVVFSQWLRMHELLVRRIKRRGWGHVLFHGGVPGSKRKDLIDRFRDDPQCRIFLSTDAGGVGLNLQHASVVLNMDLPWNPAVLEQRIGRVHRLGQREPVRVVNFVAKGTIEEGMLSVLKFKKSLFGGVLDGGEKEVFLGGSRLNKFMEQVEAASDAITDTMLEDAEDALHSLPDVQGEPLPNGRRARPGKRGTSLPDPRTAGLAAMSEIEEEPTAPTAPASDAWSGLLQAGLSLVQQLATALPNGNKASGRVSTAPSPSLDGRSLIQRDERTGEPYLKLPVPSPEVLEQALKGIAALLEGFKK